MDPYLESRAFWSDFHGTVVHRIRALLAEDLPDGYHARVDERMALWVGESEEHSSPDVGIVRRGREEDADAASLVPEGSVLLRTEMPEEHRETYIEIVRFPGERLVTAIEVLSYSNKIAGPDRRKYLAVRQKLLMSPAHLVEIDLLRRGRRMPMQDPLPPCHYLVLVSPRSMRPTCVVHPLSVHDPLPDVRVPLVEGTTVVLPLGRAFREAYREARYDRMIDYSADPVPAFAGDDAARVRQTAQRASG